MKKMIYFIMLAFVLCTHHIWAESMEGDSIKLWGTCVSPYVRKVVSVLEEKKLPYEINPLLPTVLLKATGQEIPVAFQQASPLGKIPALEFGSFKISDSSVIISYLEKQWPNNVSVYPKDHSEFAKAIWYEKYADTVMTEVFYKIFFERVVKPAVLKIPSDEHQVEEHMKGVPVILLYLENALRENQGKYLIGNHLTIGDIAITHHFIGMRMAQVILDLDPYPFLSKYLEKVLVHPSIQIAVKKI